MLLAYETKAVISPDDMMNIMAEWKYYIEFICYVKFYGNEWLQNENIIDYEINTVSLFLWGIKTNR